MEFTRVAPVDKNGEILLPNVIKSCCVLCLHSFVCLKSKIRFQILTHLQVPVKGNYQFEEVDEFVGVFSGGEVHEVPRDPVAQAGAGLDRHLAGSVAKRRAFLHMNAT